MAASHPQKQVKRAVVFVALRSAVVRVLSDPASESELAESEPARCSASGTERSQALLCHAGLQMQDNGSVMAQAPLQDNSDSDSTDR
jgi:hypothetical protein